MIHFMFTNPEKDLLDVRWLPIVSTYGFEHLKKQAEALFAVNSNHPLKEAMDALEAHLQLLPIQGVYASMRENDEAKPYKTPKGEFPPSHRQSYCALGPGTPANRFAGFHKPQHSPVPITNHPSTWGWGVADLAPHAPLLAKFAKQHGVTFTTQSITKVASWGKDFEQGRLSLRVKDLELDLARNEAFVIYNHKWNGYLNPQGNKSTLAGARMFEGRASAEKWIKKNSYYGKESVIMPIQIKLMDPDLSSLPPDHASKFSLAMAQMKKEELENALRDHQLEQSAAQAPQPRKKM